MGKKKHRLIQFIALIFVVGLLIVFAIGLHSQNHAVSVGDKAIDFELEDLEGNIHRLSDQEGKIVILNFFATWCKTCEKEMPTLIEFQKEFGNDVSYFTVAMSDSKRSIKKYIKRTGYDIPYFFDFNFSIADDYGIVGQPETVIIDENGILNKHFVGPVSQELLSTEVNKLIN